ncbi:hypothetical protein L7F22_004267 [Adiantum nelumboides]|nr:hypothetical protein [Adiantum nelumboides]
MDDVKNQFKGFVKKFTSPSSSRFKGEGHKLGSRQESSQQPAKAQAPPPQQPPDWRKLQQERWERERSPRPTPGQDRSHPSTSSSSQPQPCNVSISPSSAAAAAPALPISSVPTSSKQLNGSSADGHIAVKGDILGDAKNLQKGNGSDQPIEALDRTDVDVVHEDASKPNVNQEGILSSSESGGVPSHNSKVRAARNESAPGFDPFCSQIGSLSTGTNMSGLQMCQCPICGSWWKSETEVNAHIDECLSQSTCTSLDNKSEMDTKLGDTNQTKVMLGVFLSGAPSSETIDVFLRILRNIQRSPELEKFRKIRLSNPKIQDTVGMALGGVELLEALGFTFQTEGEEIWAVMDPPSMDEIDVLQEVIVQLEKCGSGSFKEDVSSKEKAPMRREVDRHVRVFYASPENIAAKMEVPDSFFQLSASELRQEAAARRKKLEDSQLLISKVSRDRMAAANKRKYKAAIIRIQFPDGVVLQGMFLPWEPTTAIYESTFDKAKKHKKHGEVPSSSSSSSDSSSDSSEEERKGKKRSKKQRNGKGKKKTRKSKSLRVDDSSTEYTSTDSPDYEDGHFYANKNFYKANQYDFLEDKSKKVREFRGVIEGDYNAFKRGFVSNSLRDPSTQFTLVAPGISKKQIISAFAGDQAKIPTLEEANLVPAVLVKFQCAESDSFTFTGLHPDILVAIEPLSSTTLPCVQPGGREELKLLHSCIRFPSGEEGNMGLSNAANKPCKNKGSVVKQ